MKLRPTLLLCALLLPLAGCSVIDFAYNNAPSFIANEFEDAFDLDAEQVQALEARLQGFFTWHRNHELEAYQVLLDGAAAAAADGLSRDEILALHVALRSAYRRSLARLVDDIGDLTLTLTPRQVENFRQYFRDKSAEHEDYLEKSAQQRDIFRARRNLERLESWFGRFDESLDTKVLARLQQLPDLYAPWLEYRQAQHQALLRTLNNSDATSVKRALKQVLIGDATAYAQAFEPDRVAFWQAYAAALADISNWVSKAQRQKAISRLQNYARIASRLNRQG